MIIRMTVHDNDFQDIMSGFVHNLYNGLTSISTDLYTKYTLEDPDSEAFDEYIQCSIRVNKIRELLNPNTTLVLSDDEKQLILQRVKSIFDDYVTHHEPNKNAADYLRNQFEASIRQRRKRRSLVLVPNIRLRHEPITGGGYIYVSEIHDFHGYIHYLRSL